MKRLVKKVSDYNHTYPPPDTDLEQVVRGNVWTKAYNHTRLRVTGSVMDFVKRCQTDHVNRRRPALFHIWGRIKKICSQRSY